MPLVEPDRALDPRQRQNVQHQFRVARFLQSRVGKRLVHRPEDNASLAQFEGNQHRLTLTGGKDDKIIALGLKDSLHLYVFQIESAGGIEERSFPGWHAASLGKIV